MQKLMYIILFSIILFISSISFVILSIHQVLAQPSGGTQPSTKNQTKALIDKGTYLDSLGRYNEAVAHFDKALSIVPNDVSALYGKAISLDDLGRYGEAITYFDKVLKIYPNNDHALNSKGISLAKMGRYGEAITYFDKVLKINPNHKYAMHNKIKAVQMLNTVQQAIKPQAKYLRYQNNTFGISIDYPSGWLVEPVSPPHSHPNIKIVEFKSKIGSLSIIEEPLPYKEISLNEFATIAIHTMKSTFPNFHIVQDLTPTTLAGYPAYEAVFTLSTGNLLTNVKSIYTKINEKAFTVMYTSDNALFLPIAQKMIDSFKIISMGKILNNNTNMTATFLRYENKTNGISIDYPSGWLVKPLTSLLLQTGVASPQTHTIAFVSPINSSGSAVDITTEPLSPANISLYDSTRNGIENAKRVFPNFHIVQDLTPTTLAGHQAYKWVYTTTAASGIEFMQIKTQTIAKAYSIVFASPLDLYNASLPIAQKMINSFKIISDFLRYENKTYGISIEYPSDWIVNPPSGPLTSDILVNNATSIDQQMFRFVSSLHTAAVLGIVAPSITNTSKEYIDRVINYNKQFSPGFRVEDLSPTTLAGYPAYQMTSTAGIGKMEIKSIEIVAIINEKMYRITYGSRPDLYNASLPIAQKMINSFSDVIAAAPQPPIIFKESDINSDSNKSVFVLIPTKHIVDVEGTMHIFGKIKNGGTSTVILMRAPVDATFQNSAGEPIAHAFSETGSMDIKLAPGESSSFELKVSPSDFFSSSRDFRQIASIEYGVNLMPEPLIK